MKKKDRQPILVPIDFSPASEEALRLGVTIADCVQANVAVVHVVHDPGDAPGYYNVKGRKKQLRRMEDVASEMLDGFLSRMKSELSGHPSAERMDKVLVIGLPVTRILELVEKLDPSMVIMGSTGRTGLARAVLGSKAEQIVRLCPVPVTIVKASIPADDD